MFHLNYCTIFLEGLRKTDNLRQKSQSLCQDSNLGLQNSNAIYICALTVDIRF